MNFKKAIDIINEEEGKIGEINGYKFYLKMGKEGNIPHIHYIGETVGCIAIEYAAYFNHEQGMKQLTSAAEKELLHILNSNDEWWNRMVKMWNMLFPHNKVRINYNPYRNAKHILPSVPSTRPEA